MSAEYKLTNSTSILKLADGNYKTLIPADENNEDYQAYLTWIAAGNTADAADAEAGITTYVSKLTIVDRLIALEKLSDALTALNSDATKKARWDASTEIDTEDEQVKSLLTACGIDPKDVLY